MGAACSSLDLSTACSIHRDANGTPAKSQIQAPESSKKKADKDRLSGAKQGGGKGKKTDIKRHQKNLKRLQKVALDVFGQLNHFHLFVRTNFLTSADAFDAIVTNCSGESVEMRQFTDAVQKLGFAGDAEKVFYGLCDCEMGSDTRHIVTRDVFMKRLDGMGSPFVQLVRQACFRDREKIQKRVAQIMAERTRDPRIVEAFRQFIEPRFPVPETCFNAIAGEEDEIDENKLVQWLAGLEFDGDASKVFRNICDANGYISRAGFANAFVVPDVDAPSAENPQEPGAVHDNAPEVPETLVSTKNKKKVKKRPSKLESDEGVCGENQDEEADAPAPMTARKSMKKRSSKVDVVEGDGAEHAEDEEADDPAPVTARRSMKKRSSKVDVIEGDGAEHDQDEEADAPAPMTARKSLQKRSSKVDVIEGDGAEHAEDEEAEAPAPVTARKSMKKRSSNVDVIEGDGAQHAQDEEADAPAPIAARKPMKKRSSKVDLIEGDDAERDENRRAPLSPKGKAKAKRRTSKLSSGSDQRDVSETPVSPKGKNKAKGGEELGSSEKKLATRRGSASVETPVSSKGKNKAKEDEELGSSEKASAKTRARRTSISSTSAKGLVGGPPAQDEALAGA